jgi:hypothetical protein
MIELDDIMASIRGAFPVFSYGEKYTDDFLETTYSFDDDGMRQRWEMFDRLTNGVRAFLRTRYPAISEHTRASYSDLQMKPFQEKIARKVREYEHYKSLAVS